MELLKIPTNEKEEKDSFSLAIKTAGKILPFDMKLYMLLMEARAEGLRESKAEGEIEGENGLFNAIQAVRKGMPYEELVSYYGERTAEKALLLK